jgi:hypothetical protein
MRLANTSLPPRKLKPHVKRNKKEEKGGNLGRSFMYTFPPFLPKEYFIICVLHALGKGKKGVNQKKEKGFLESFKIANREKD